MSFPLCFPAAVFRAWKPRRATPQNPQTTTMLNPYDRIKALITRYHEKQAENGFRLV